MVGFNNCGIEYLAKLPSCLPYRASLGDPSDLKTNLLDESNQHLHTYITILHFDRMNFSIKYLNNNIVYMTMI